MTKKRLFYTLLFCAVLAAAWVASPLSQTIAEDKATYVGTEKCTECHEDLAKQWALTSHRPVLFNKDESRRGCEGCHGPGSKHVEEGGSPEYIKRFAKLKPAEVADTCMKCHTQEHVTLWRTSTHSRAKVGCLNCHVVHGPSTPAMLKSVENGKLDLQGLTKNIQAAQLEANTAPMGSKERDAALAKVDQLREKEATLRAEVKGAETAYQKAAEPYLCYNCHKDKQMQANMPSHHPIPENKMNCSSCHNPHGGAKGMLKEESVTETCFRCHAEKEGPFTFDHPPVSEDCTICHNPHGTVQNNLLIQGEPFLCMRCHVAPHSRSKTLGDPKAFSQYYVRCTSCHNQVHGSDEHSAFHF